jgi:hypothetical protein
VDEEASLRQAVEEHARALVDGDLATFASYVTEEALPQLYRAIRSDDVRSAHVVSVTSDGDFGESVVQLRGAATFELRGSWQRTSSRWKATQLVIPPESVRMPWWRRILGRKATAIPQREDLA